MKDRYDFEDMVYYDEDADPVSFTAYGGGISLQIPGGLASNTQREIDAFCRFAKDVLRDAKAEYKREEWTNEHRFNY